MAPVAVAKKMLAKPHPSKYKFIKSDTGAKQSRKRTVRPGTCANCGCNEQDTTLWRSNESPDAGHLCNACGLWWKEKHTQRPASLWKKKEGAATASPEAPPCPPLPERPSVLPRGATLSPLTSAMTLRPRTRSAARALSPIDIDSACDTDSLGTESDDDVLATPICSDMPEPPSPITHTLLALSQCANAAGPGGDDLDTFAATALLNLLQARSETKGDFKTPNFGFGPAVPPLTPPLQSRPSLPRRLESNFLEASDRYTPSWITNERTTVILPPGFDRRGFRPPTSPGAYSLASATPRRAPPSPVPMRRTSVQTLSRLDMRPMSLHRRFSDSNIASTATASDPRRPPPTMREHGSWSRVPRPRVRQTASYPSTPAEELPRQVWPALLPPAM